MKNMLNPCLLACAALVVAQSLGIAAQKSTAGSVVFHIVGRNQITAVTSPTSGSSVAFGYLTYLQGVSGSLFSDPNAISEKTAYFTFIG